jgi:hypothetical protein
VVELGRIALAETPDGRTKVATELAHRLIDLADDDDSASLASLLRANPKREASVWRVLQFRLGDVSPSRTVAYDDPATAVLALARPGDGGLVAGELLAVDADGSAWTAVARTDDELVLQLPSPRTLSGPAAAPDAIGPLLLAWREALGARPPAPPAPPERPAPAAVSVSAPLAAPVAPTAERRAVDLTLSEVLDRLDAPGAPLDRLRAALQADLAARLTAIEARLALSAEEGARIAVARSIDDIRDELHLLREQLTRMEKHLTG